MATTDTHTLFKALIDSGIQKEHAEVFVAHFVSRNELDGDKLSLITKADLLKVEYTLKTEIVELKTEITEFKTELRTDMRWIKGLLIPIVTAATVIVIKMIT